MLKHTIKISLTKLIDVLCMFLRYCDLVRQYIILNTIADDGGFFRFLA